MTNLETKYRALEKRVVDTEKSSEFHARSFDENNKHIKTTQDQLKHLIKQCDSLVTKSNMLREEKETMETKLDELECQSLRENLLFYSLPENDINNCVSTIKELCTKVLEIPSAKDHLIEKAHRIGRKSHGKPRQILASYHYIAERDVRLKSYDKADELKKAGYGVG